MPASTILRLARTMRWASVLSLTRNARAICGVVRPTTARRVSASRASGASAGWQHANSSASRSSVPDPAGAGGRGPGGQVRCRVLRRTPSRALRWAATWSHAPGLSGGPSRRQVVSASTTADCTASSARSKSPNRRESRATNGPASSRSTCARRPSVGAVLTWRRSLELRVVLDHRPDLDRAAGEFRLGQVLVTAIAASMSGTSMIENPPMISLASLNGPSTTTGPSAPYFTLVAVSTPSSSAPPSAMTPAFSSNHA